MTTLNRIHGKFADWLSSYSTRLSDKSLTAYKLVIEGMLHYLNAQHIERLNDVDTELLHRYIYLRSNQLPYAKASVYQRIAALDLFFTWAYENRLVRANPILSVKKSRIQLRSLAARAEQPLAEKPEVMMPIEQAAVLEMETLNRQNNFVSIRDKAIITLLLASALYVAELTTLTLADFDLEQGILMVGEKGRAQSKRQVKFNPNCQAACQAWLKMRESFLAGREQPLLFFTCKLKPLTQGILYKQISLHLSRAGIDKKQKGADLIRQTAISNMLQNGDTIAAVQKNTGYKHPARLHWYQAI